MTAKTFSSMGTVKGSELGGTDRGWLLGRITESAMQEVGWQGETPEEA